MCCCGKDWRASWLGVCFPALWGKQQKPGFTEQTSTMKGSMCAVLFSPPLSAPPVLKSLIASHFASFYPSPLPLQVSPSCLFLQWQVELGPGVGDQRARPLCVSEHVHEAWGRSRTPGRMAHTVCFDGKTQSGDSTHLCILPALVSHRAERAVWKKKKNLCCKYLHALSNYLDHFVCSFQNKN